MLTGLISQNTPGLTPSAEDSPSSNHFPTDHKVLTNEQSPKHSRSKAEYTNSSKSQGQARRFAQTLDKKLPTANLKFRVFIGITLLIFSLYSSTTGALPTSSISTTGT
jgi:hypothetical protein